MEAFHPVRAITPACGTSFPPWARLVGKVRDPIVLGEGDFWALREVSFKVGPGDALGIIGPNGAGKSTVLKTLTRILRPTLGSCG